MSSVSTFLKSHAGENWQAVEAEYYSRKHRRNVRGQVMALLDSDGNVVEVDEDRRVDAFGADAIDPYQGAEFF